MYPYQKIIGRFFQTSETKLYQYFEELKQNHFSPEEAEEIERILVKRSKLLRKLKMKSVNFFSFPPEKNTIDHIECLPENVKMEFKKHFEDIFDNREVVMSLIKNEMISFRINSQTKEELNKSAQDHKTSVGDFLMGFAQLGYRLHSALKNELQKRGINNVDTFGLLKNYESIALYLADVIHQEMKAEEGEMKEE